MTLAEGIYDRVSFDVLCNEIRGLGLDMQQEKAGAEGDDDLL